MATTVAIAWEGFDAPAYPRTTSLPNCHWHPKRRESNPKRNGDSLFPCVNCQMANFYPINGRVDVTSHPIPMWHSVTGAERGNIPLTPSTLPRITPRSTPNQNHWSNTRLFWSPSQTDITQMNIIPNQLSHQCRWIEGWKIGDTCHHRGVGWQDVLSGGNSHGVGGLCCEFFLGV